MERGEARTKIGTGRVKNDLQQQYLHQLVRPQRHQQLQHPLQPPRHKHPPHPLDDALTRQGIRGSCLLCSPAPSSDSPITGGDGVKVNSDE